MQTVGKTYTGFLLFMALFVSSLGLSAHAQTGQTVPPGVQNQSGTTGPCSNVDASGMPVSPNDSSCGAFAPGFAAPSTNTPSGDNALRQVTALVRVEAIVEKPVSTPFPVDFTTVGGATMVKAKMPRVAACFKAGKALSDRSGAATSTTCLDHKGEVIAYQECKPKSGVTPAACSTVMPKEQPTVASAKP